MYTPCDKCQQPHTDGVWLVFKRGMTGGVALRITRSKAEQMAVLGVFHRIPNQPVWQLETSRRRTGVCAEISPAEGIHSSDKLTILLWPSFSSEDAPQFTLRNEPRSPPTNETYVNEWTLQEDDTSLKQCAVTRLRTYTDKRAVSGHN